jgi:lipoate-protein ligase A
VTGQGTSPRRVFRVIDTGLRDGRANIAFDQALIDSRREGRIPDTIRFLTFRPTALVGRHQVLGAEIRLDHCRAAGIGVARRITGGGAIYFDEKQLGWELAFQRNALGTADLAETTKAICEAAAAGISRLGVDARFRPRNDIEVGGRKLCGTGGFFDGDVLFYQGTLLIDTDPQAMVAALRIPEAKLARHALDSAARRVVTLNELLDGALPTPDEIRAALLAGFAERLGIEAQPGAPSAEEEALARKLHDEEIGTDAFVAEIDTPRLGGDVFSASRGLPGGTITAYLRKEGGGDLVRDALITGDFFVAPPRVVFDLEARLRGAPVAAIGDTVEAFFREAAPEALSLSAADFAAVLTDAAATAPAS